MGALGRSHTRYGVTLATARNRQPREAGPPRLSPAAGQPVPPLEGGGWVGGTDPSPPAPTLPRPSPRDLQAGLDYGKAPSIA